jgi:replicative DNA helicase
MLVLESIRDVIPFSRMPPMNVEAELCVLGSMLLDNSTIDEVSPFLAPENFYRDEHVLLCRAIFALRSSGLPVDALILLDYLRREAVPFEEQTIRDALQAPPHSVNAVYYGQIVKQLATARSLIEASDETIRESYSGLLTADELTERAESRVYAISDASTAGMTTELSEALDEASEALKRRHGGEVIGVASGWSDLDEIICGFQPGTLTIIGGRPSMGKTAAILNICEFNATSGVGERPYFVSLEMGRLEVANRLIQSLGRVDGYKIKNPHKLDRDEWSRLASARDRLRDCSFPIDDTSSRTVGQIAANARRQRARRGIGLVVVDYLQLIEGENPRDSRQEQITKITRRLKTLARELQVPVIALSQLNRMVEGREDHRPRMADLRESGAIEQDADVVLLVHRPEYYDPNDQPGIAEIIVAKNRNGQVDTVKLVFHKQFARFDNLSHQYEL